MASVPNQLLNGESKNALVATNLPAPGTRVSALSRRPEPTEDEREQNRKLLELAQQRFEVVLNNDRDWRRQVEQESLFLAGQHWTQAQTDERKGRPCLTFNKIGPSIDQVVNDARQSPPEPRISPVGNGADKETAQILQGLIRNIEQDSRADIAYLTGYEQAVAYGRGWFRINIDYENDVDFTQKLLIKRIANLFSVYPDPATDEFDYSNMRYCFVTEDLDRTIFEEMYPDQAGMANFEGVGDKIKENWFPKGAVRVAEYWYVETTETEISQLADGRIMPADEVPDGEEVRNTRTVEKRQVKWAKICGNGVLKRNDNYVGKWIPLIAVLGKEVTKGGTRVLRGMIHDAMDANLSYDVMRSKQVEAVGLTPLSSWLAAEGQLENYEEQFANANRKAISVLYYKTHDAEGNPVAPPQRLTAAPDIQAITVAVQYADNDCQSQLATYRPQLGAPSPEASGRAIIARQREGDNAHFNYHDNLARAMQHAGRVMLDLIPRVYSEERVITVFDPDGKNRQVPINQVHMKEGVERIYNIKEGIGRYDVVIGSGPSYASRRQQGVDAFLQLFQAAPAAMIRCLDLGIRMMDMPLGDEIADRMRPPDVPNPDEPQPISPQAQAQITQLQQALQQAQMLMQQQGQMIQSKVLELESKERIATEANRTQILLAEIKAQTQESAELVRREFAATKHRLDLLHESAGIEADIADNERQAQLQQQQLEQQAQQAAAEQAQAAQQGQPGQGQ